MGQKWLQNLEKHLFLDITSTNIDTLSPSLYQCVETRSIKVMTVVSGTPAPPFQPLCHRRNICHQSFSFNDPNKWKTHFQP
jgi:hypothetical protein